MRFVIYLELEYYAPVELGPRYPALNSLILFLANGAPEPARMQSEVTAVTGRERVGTSG